jgi:hypothetical protein
VIRPPDQLRELIDSGRPAHLTTINSDGSPQVSVIWIGPDGEPVSGHMEPPPEAAQHRTRPRVALSFDGPREPGVVFNPYAVLHVRASVQPSDHTWDLLNRLAKAYTSPDNEFLPQRLLKPAPRMRMRAGMARRYGWGTMRM